VRKLAPLLLLALLVGIAHAAPGESNVAGCNRAIIGSGRSDWHSYSVVAGPVGFPEGALHSMSRTGNGQLVAKAPIVVEGHSRVMISVPPALRHRVFLYYGRVIGRNGQPTTSFTESGGYSATEFIPCEDKPRTVWPGGVRVKGNGPVRLSVTMLGRFGPIFLHLGRPKPLRAPPSGR
jgi:hypothetical protein